MAIGFDLSSIDGLSSQEAARRLSAEGYNELPSARQRGAVTIALEVVRQPMFILLVASGAIYALLGNLGDAGMLLVFVFIVMGVTIYQERKTERALDALRDLSSPRALVVRDREPKRIAGRDVVRGDILILSEGDRVPADAIVLASNDLSADESLLTGEAVPVRKTAAHGEAKMQRPGGDDLPSVYSGTMIVQGRAIARVEATGIHTEMGRIGKSLQTAQSGEAPLQEKSKHLVRACAIAGLTLCAAVTIIYGLSRDGWLKGLLAGIALAMALLPEEIPVVLTIFLALGAWRISQKRVLTRRIPAVETLGSATVLCVDKTGTLTLNQMTVKELFAGGKSLAVDEKKAGPLPQAFDELLEFAILASEPEPFDPIERALKQLGNRCLDSAEEHFKGWSLVHEYSLSPQLLALSHIWQPPRAEEFLIAAKGSPEAIAELCHLDKRQIEDLLSAIGSMAREGLRVLGVAKARCDSREWPSSQHDFDFVFLGLVGLADPVRPSVPDAIRECRQASIRVLMITGDYPVTAQAIAREIGLPHPEAILTGAQIETMEAEELGTRLREVNVCARILPEQKLRIVEALKANGEIVAMTGDGVNDAPALQSAHIGIAMGSRGTDVAREAAALVLLDDDFSSITRAVQLGRRIFDNLRKAIRYILAIHVPIAGMVLIPLAAGWPLVLWPIHIVFLELIIDPACSIVFEAEREETDLMRRPPRNPEEPLVDKLSLWWSVIQGAVVLAAGLIVFRLSLTQTSNELYARTLSFVTLVAANLGLILVNRSWLRSVIETLRVPNGPFWWVMTGTLVFLLLAIYFPLLAELFRFARPTALDLGISLAAGALSALWFEGAKRVAGRSA